MSKSDETVNDLRLSIIQHLTELRKCIVKAVIGWMIGCILVYQFIEEIYYYLTVPFDIKELVYLAPTEAFVTYIHITLVGGFVVASPIIFYQFLRFVLPGLYRKEKKVLFVIVPSAFLLMIGGVAFGYFVMLPVALDYLLNFGSLNIKPMLSVTKYISFVSITLMVMGVIFEVPLVIIGLTKLGIVTPEFLRKNRKYAIVLAVIIGAILTPPDVISQILLAGPLILLYEISIWLSYLFKRGRQKKKESMINDV